LLTFFFHISSCETFIKKDTTDKKLSLVVFTYPQHQQSFTTDKMVGMPVRKQVGYNDRQILDNMGAFQIVYDTDTDSDGSRSTPVTDRESTAVQHSSHQDRVSSGGLQHSRVMHPMIQRKEVRH
jgi:hypothetical protein